MDLLNVVIFSPQILFFLFLCKQKSNACLETSENVVGQRNVETFKHVSYSLTKELHETKNKVQELQKSLL